MTRGHGWRFLDLGRRLERALSVLKLLQGVLRIRLPLAVLEPVLEIADSVMTYRRRYFTAPHLAGVLDLLLRDESNPRSLIFQINVLHQHAIGLATDSKSGNNHLDPVRIQSLAAAIQAFNLNDIITDASQLLPLLNSWASALAEISDEVTTRYFSHSIPRASS